jgi:hypothetical protein
MEQLMVAQRDSRTAGYLGYDVQSQDSRLARVDVEPVEQARDPQFLLRTGSEGHSPR